MPSSDILIIGGGLAGLFCALKLAPRPVTILAAAPLGQGSSSAWAQGGIAAAMSEGDSPENHTRDTVAAGAGIVDEAVALGMAREAGARVRDLIGYGAPFDRDLQGRLAFSQEAAHSARRIVRVRGDTAGKAIMDALIAAVRACPSINVQEGLTAEELIVRDGRVFGVLAREHEGRLLAFPAGATVLATGGAGYLYRVTTNPPPARASGLALAARAGAMIADAEFVQFHPTAIDIGRDPAPLATEALRGEGAILIDREGRRFMRDVHRDAELAPRDVVARAVFAQIASGRGAFLDARAAIGQSFAERFPTVFAACESAGVNPILAPIPVAPAAHYHMGGVATDARGATSLPGLWAVGEAASTGVHGANRLASNSLLEAVVFAARAAQDLARLEAQAPAGDFPVAASAQSADGVAGDEDLVVRLRATMSAHVGVIRDESGLMTAVREICGVEREAHSRQTKNMAVSALLIAAAARARTESRGAHARSDFPNADPRQAQRSRLSLAQAQECAAQAIGA